MKYELNFGAIDGPLPARNDLGAFRIAVLGDFSARANRGEVKIGDELAARKAHRVDVDNLDDVISRFNVELHLNIAASGTVKVPVRSMDDLHPDGLCDNVEVFGELSALRQRLKGSQFAAAASEVQSWLGDAMHQHDLRPTKARGTAIPASKLSDLAALIDRPVSKPRETAADELIKQVVGPYIQAEADPRQEQLVAAVDEAMSGALRNILHHPDFQAHEALWRCVELLVRRLETDTQLQIVLYDVTAEELAADLSSSGNLVDSGVYKLLVEEPAANQTPLSVIIGNYVFEPIPPHAELVGRIAKIAAAAKAPFIAAIGKDVVNVKKPEDVHPLVLESWSAVRQLPAAAYVGLAVPRFMLRWPYGAKTEPIEPFKFEEFTKQSGVRGMLWGNSAFLVGLLLGHTYSAQGLKSMKLGSITSLGDMPFHYYIDPYGDQVALPCTERLLNVRLAEHVRSQRFIPIISVQGRPDVKVGGFLALGDGDLAGPWNPRDVDVSGAVPAGIATAPPPGAANVEQAAAQEPAAPDPMAALDNELDNLFADLGVPAAAAEEKPAEPADELDSLLASFDAPPQPAEENGAAAEMDPELASLLADL